MKPLSLINCSTEFMSAILEAMIPGKYREGCNIHSQLLCKAAPKGGKTESIFHTCEKMVSEASDWSYEMFH